MKTIFQKVALLAIFSAFLVVGCQKDNTTDPISSLEDMTLTSSEKEGELTVLHFEGEGNPVESRSLTDDFAPAGNEAEERGALFCCNVNWVGFNNNAFTWQTTRYSVSSANAYRNKYTIFRNDVLYFSGNVASSAIPSCPNSTTSLNLGNLGNCCGVFSATLEQQYRVGNTWYTCDADQGEFSYFPQGCNFCE